MKTTLNNSESNNIRKSVKVKVNDNMKFEYGVRYFTVYQVRSLNALGHKVYIDCYLNKKDAEKRVKSINTNFRHVYGLSYIFELKVFC